MKVILNCSPDGSAVPALNRRQPLVLTPFLGATVLEHTLSALAATGIQSVRLEAGDCVDDILRVAGRGETWGLRIEVARVPSTDAGDADVRRVFMETLPQAPDHPLWQSYGHWHAAQVRLLPELAAQRVGMKPVAPGVHVGLRSEIASSARLVGPCWIGAHVFIGPETVVGPGTIIEDGCYIDRGAEVSGSIVGQQTYVGKFTEVRRSWASGGELLHLDSGSLAELADPFLLGTLSPPSRWLGSWTHLLRRVLGIRPVVGDGTRRAIASQPGQPLRAAPAN